MSVPTSSQTPPWDSPNNVTEFCQQFENDSSTLYGHIVTLIQRLRNERSHATTRLEKSNSERDEEKRKLVSAYEERDRAIAQLSLAHQSIDQLEEQSTKLNLELNIARAGYLSNIASKENTENPPKHNFRSEKFPDPQKFNGARAELPGFLTQLRMKLEVNDDRFRNESAKVIYSISRLEGRALDQVVPLVNANQSAPFSSVDAFIAHLNASFGDPDPRGTARRELKTLKQGNGDFAEYYSQFLRIIAYLDYNESAKIDALVTGISEDLKDSLVYHEGQPNTLEKYATMLMNTDNKIRGRKAEQKYTWNSSAQPSYPTNGLPSHVPGGLTPMDLSALRSQPVARPPLDQRYTFVNGTRKTSAAEKHWRKGNNLCMYCAGSGHVFSNCPVPNRTRNSQVTMTGALLAPILPNDNIESPPLNG